MKVVSSLKSVKKRAIAAGGQVVRRKNKSGTRTKVVVICKRNPKFKARQR